MRGRKPKPAALSAMEGNPGKRATKKNAPNPGFLGDPPADLDDVARAKWFEQTKPMVWGQVVTAADADMLAEYCRLHARKTKAEAMIKELGELVASPNGFPVQSPWLQIVNKCRADMHRIQSEFGGSPSARTRVVAENIEAGKSKFAGLVAIGGGRIA